MAQNSSTPVLVGWAQSPNFRGTADILWSCLFTLLACTWSILHLNVPARGRGTVYKLGRKVLCMIFAVLAPELLTSQAYLQWREASQEVRKMQQLGLDEWTIAHSFFAEMGALAIRFDDGTLQTIDCYLLRDYLGSATISVTDVSFSEADVEDRSKSDYFTKTITVLQSIWFVSQCIARAAQHLALSQLEIATCAYVACAVATYFFWRYKPLDVECQTVIGTPIQKENLKLGIWSYQKQQSYHPKALQDLGGTTMSGVILYAMGIVFCAVHCLAWNFDFPTDREACLWKVFAASSSGAAAVMLLILAQYHGLRALRTSKGNLKLFGIESSNAIAKARTTVQSLLALLYFAGRIYLIFAMFYLLRSMPSSVYETVDWTVYLPHWI